jgi:small subunit ribosomal protein S15
MWYQQRRLSGGSVVLGLEKREHTNGSWTWTPHSIDVLSFPLCSLTHPSCLSVTYVHPTHPAQNTKVGLVSQSKPLFLAADADEADVEEAAPEDFIVNVGDIDDEPVDEAADDSDPAWAVLNERITEMRIKYRRSESDTGSPEFQVAGITERITYLTSHLKEHPKDFSTRRGLVALVNKRRRLLNYLFNEDVGRYSDLLASMGIRHKPPTKVQSRDTKYGRFPKQKANKYANQLAKLRST